MGYVSNSENAHLKFGLIYHSAIEAYDHARIKGSTHADATIAAVRHALTQTWDETLQRPWQSEHNIKTRETLIRTIVWYLDQFADDPCRTITLANGKPAVELSFRFELGLNSRLTNEPYILCGHLDRVVEFQGATWVTDKKTSKSTLSESYFANYTPDNQVSLYSLAGILIFNQPISGVIIDAAQVAVTFSRFQRALIQRTRSQLDEWKDDLIYTIQQMEYYAKNNYWPQNDSACGLYGGCPYRGICSISPELREKHLEAMFSKRIWDPLQTR